MSRKNDFKEKLEQESRAKRSSKNAISIKNSDKQKISITDSTSSSNLNQNKNLNPYINDINTNSNPSNNSGDNRNSTEKNSSKSSKEKKEKYPITYYKNFAYSIAVKMNGKIEKSENELNLENKLNHYTRYLSMLPNTEKIKSEINFKTSNYNNISNNNVTRTYNVKSEEKSNTKINFEQFINYDDIPIYRSDSPNIILSDKLNVENDDHKLDYLIKLLETYKDIIIEQNYCKSYQDRIVLNIYIDLSTISFKLYNTPEKIKSKINYLRKYMCNLTDDIKYNILKYPNKTLSSINQKFIDISQINPSYIEELISNENSSVNEESSDKESSNENLFTNKDESQEDDNKKKIPKTEKIKENINEKNQTSSVNYSSMKLLENSKTSFTENSDKEKIEYKNYDDEDSDILYENLEEFNDNDDDIGYNNSVDGKIFNNSDYDNSIDENNDYNYNYYNPINNINPSEFANSVGFKRCMRRNATHNISVSGKIYYNNSSKVNLTKVNNNLQDKEIKYEIIDFNDVENISHIENKNQTFFESAEVFKAIEIHSKNIQNLIFSEDNKKQRKYNSFHTDEFLITADGNNQKKLKEMGDIISNNIISIVKKSGNVIPNHDEKMTPIEINDYIIDKEKQIKEESNPRNRADIKDYYDFEEKEESEEDIDENEEEEEESEEENSENLGEESDENYEGEEEEKKIEDDDVLKNSKSFEGHEIYDNLEKGKKIFEFEIEGEDDN